MDGLLQESAARVLLFQRGAVGVFVEPYNNVLTDDCGWSSKVTCATQHGIESLISGFTAAGELGHFLTLGDHHGFRFGQ